MPLTIRTVLMALVAKKAEGKVAGLLVSKTQMGASLAGLSGLWALLPAILEKDPNAIGNAALIILGWLMALYGRWKAGRA